MFQEYLAAISENAPIVIASVLGLGTLYGKFGLSGKVQLAACSITGATVGAGFHIASLGMPASFPEWFYVGLTAVVLGLLPSGIYEAVKAAAK